MEELLGKRKARNLDRKNERYLNYVWHGNPWGIARSKPLIFHRDKREPVSAHDFACSMSQSGSPWVREK